MPPTKKTERFLAWLDKEMKLRNLNDAQLERMAGIGQGVISNVRSGRRNVGPAVLEKIADALNLPVELVYREAGRLPPYRGRSVEQAEIDHLVGQLSKADRQEILAIVKTIYERRRGRKT